MNKAALVLKPRGLHWKFLIRLEESANNIKNNSKKDCIPFPIIFEKVCRAFSVTKKEAWEILFLLHDFGLIEIVRGHGIKLNFKINYEK